MTDCSDETFFTNIVLYELVYLFCMHTLIGQVRYTHACLICYYRSVEDTCLKHSTTKEPLLLMRFKIWIHDNYQNECKLVKYVYFQ